MINFNSFKELDKLIREHKILQKDVLTFKETCEYLGLSASYLYKLTSGRKIPHSCPQGKMLYFDRRELDDWALQNKRKTSGEYEKEASDYLKMPARKY